MNPNTPTSRRSRSNTPQQQEGNQHFTQNMNQPGFVAYSQGGPQGGFQGGFQQGFQGGFQPGYQQFSQQGFQQLPHSGYQGFQGGFQNLLNQGSQAVQHQDFSSGFSMGNDDDDDVEEFVPDTQPPPQTDKGKGKGKKFENRAKRQYWTTPEEVALARAWVDVSEDSVVGNGQQKACFYGRVLNVFHNIMGRSYRTKDQVTTKFSQLNKLSGQFGAIHNNLVNSRQSGQNDQDIMEMAYSRYQNRYAKAFTMQHVWEILKECPKWEGVSPMQTSRSSKRTNPTSDDDDVEVQHQRPIGRDQAKRRGKTSASNLDEGTKQWLDGLNRLQGSFSNEASEYRLRKLDLEKDKLDVEKRKLDVETNKIRIEQERIQHEKTLRLDADLDFYLTPHDHLTGTELQKVLFRKQHLKKYHGFEF